MKNPRAEEILQEISRLRENLHKAYNENKKVTKEVLLVSTKLDHSINSYIKLLYQENSN
jgi:ribosomal protein S17E